MALARQHGQGMVVAFQADGRGVADVIDNLDAGTHLLQTEALAAQNLPVALGVQVGEAVAELERLAIDHDLPERRPPALRNLFGKRVPVDTQEVTNPGPVESDEAGHTVVGGDMHDVFLHLAENMAQHIVEVDADIGGNAAALALRTLPAGEIPVAPRGDVSQVNIIYDIVRSVIHLFLQRDYFRMKPQLQNVVDPLARLFLNGLQNVHIPWIQHQRFLADDIRAQAQGVARVRVVKVVRRADGDNVQLVVRSLHLRHMAVEKLHFGEKGRLGKIAVDNADTVGFVIRGNHLVPSIFNSFQMSRGHITAHSENGEILHV